MKSPWKPRGPRRATASPWRPPHGATHAAGGDPLRRGGTLRLQAAQAALAALLRQPAPRALPAATDAGPSPALPLPRAAWLVGGAPPRAAAGDDDLMSAPQDDAGPLASADAAPRSAAGDARAIGVDPGPGSTPWRGATAGAGPGVHPLFRIF